MKRKNDTEPKMLHEPDPSICEVMVREYQVPRYSFALSIVCALVLALISFYVTIRGWLWLMTPFEDWLDQLHPVLLFMIMLPFTLLMLAASTIAANVAASVAYSLLRWKYVTYRPCDMCYYDLTGNSSGECPECGAMIPPEV